MEVEDCRKPLREGGRLMGVNQGTAEVRWNLWFFLCWLSDSPHLSVCSVTADYRATVQNRKKLRFWLTLLFGLKAFFPELELVWRKLRKILKIASSDLSQCPLGLRQAFYHISLHVWFWHCDRFHLFPLVTGKTRGRWEPTSWYRLLSKAVIQTETDTTGWQVEKTSINFFFLVPDKLLNNEL